MNSSGIDSENHDAGGKSCCTTNDCAGTNKRKH